jgi:predicted nucleic acid-binding protein
MMQTTSGRLPSLLNFLPIRFPLSPQTYVFAESVSIISMHRGRSQALRFVDKVQEAESPYVVRRADETIDATALEFFKKQTSRNTSFVDCANVAFLQKFHMAAIFSFDRVYKTNGFLRAEEFLQTHKQAA